MRVLHGSCLAAIAAAVTACASEPSPEPLASPGIATSAGGNLHDVMRRTRLAFVESGGRFVGGTPWYGIEVAGGQIRIAHGRAGLAATPLVLSTQLISRGGGPLGATTIDAAGALHLVRGAAVEEIENREVSVEQRWRFAAAPTGAGDLVVRVAASGQVFETADRDGLHFRDPTDAAGMRYGPATWIDARGTRTRVDAIWRDGAIELTVPAAVIDASSYPAVLDPTIDPPHTLDAIIAGLSPAGDQTDPAICSIGGTTLLAVWADARREYLDSRSDIYGARLSTSGSVLDALGKALSAYDEDEGTPAVVNTGVPADPRCLVVYSRKLSSGGHVILQLTVKPDGSWTAPANISNPATQDFIHPAVAALPRVGTTPAQFLVVAESPGGSILGFRLKEDFSVTSQIAISATGTIASWPAVVGSSASRQFLTAWQVHVSGSNDDIRACTVSDTSACHTILDVTTNLGRQTNPTVAASNNEFFVAWVDYRGSNADIYRRRVTFAGAFPATDGTDVVLVDRSTPVHDPATTSDGTSFFTVYSFDSADLGDLAGTIATPSGSTMTLTPVAISTPNASMQLAPAVMFTGQGGNYVVVWSDRRNQNKLGDIYGARITTSGTDLDTAGILVSRSAQNQSSPALSYSADFDKTLVVWTDDRNGLPDIYGIFVDSAGAPTTPSAFPIAQIANSTQDHARVACTTFSAHCVVVWEDDRTGTWDVRGALVDGSGGVTPFTIPRGSTAEARAPAMAAEISDPSTMLAADAIVVWEDGRPGGGDTDIWGIRINGATGAPPPGETEFAVATGAKHQHAPAIDGPGFPDYLNRFFLIAWEEHAVSGEIEQPGDIMAMLRRFDSGLGDVTGIAIATGTRAQTRPVVLRAIEYQVAWQEDDGARSTRDVFGRTVSWNGIPWPAHQISDPGTAVESAPAMFYEATTDRNEVIWSESAPTSDFYSNIRGHSMDNSAAPVGMTYDVSSAGERERAPAADMVGTMGVDANAVVFDRFDLGSMSNRIMLTQAHP